MLYTSDKKCAKQTASKLHKQFGHPSPERLIKMIVNAGFKNLELEKEIKNISSNCITCLKFKKAAPRPIVSVPLAENFNEIIAIDLKSYDNAYFLVIVDVFSKFCSAAVINDKKPSTIVQNLFTSWISFFGAPQKIFSDNGGEFVNSTMIEFSEMFNIKLLTTAAESPWSNGIVERLNSVLGKSVSKIVSENGCSLKVALAWSVSARNALSTYSGFSPNQLVFGYNPAFPNFANDKIPALSNNTHSEIVAKNLGAMHAARQDFIKIESDAKLKRALSSNIRETDAINVEIGDQVYYKRLSSDEWKGPGVVIGRDGKQLIVKHSGYIVRVHACRLVKPKQLGKQSCVSDISTEEKYSKVAKLPVTEENCNGCVFYDEDSDTENWYEAVGERCEEPLEERTEVQEPSQLARQRYDYESNHLHKHNRVICKSGQRIRGICKSTGEAISGTIVSRAGKSTGNYKNCYNIEREDKSIASYDVVKDLEDFRVVVDEAEMLVLFNSESVMNAKQKEVSNWKTNNVYSEVPDEGQDTISVRWIVTEKVKNGVSQIKARLVARGFEEETSTMRKDSPTCAKESIRGLLAIAATKNWQCKALDIKSAYLQGDNITRDLYLVPPPEFNNGSLWKLHKTVYGLCDAARAWYLRLKSELVKLGLKISPFDKGMFTYTYKGNVEGIVCIHIDDFLYCGTSRFESYVVKEISNLFSVGSASEGSFKYVGLNIISGDQLITVDQLDYVSSIRKITLSRARNNNSKSELTKKEKGEYRALIGQLNWLATQTRPDIAFDVCFLSGSFKNATVADIKKVNKLVDRVKHQAVKIVFPKMKNIENCQLVCYSDASWANLPSEGSQGGMLIMLRDEDGNQCPIHWQSRKIRRVVKSTLAAETLALLDCAEEACHIANMISDILGTPKLKVSCEVDNKSLVEALYSKKQVDGKRLRVEIAILQEMMSMGEISKVEWIPTASQLANSLTKGGTSTKALLEAVAC